MALVGQLAQLARPAQQQVEEEGRRRRFLALRGRPRSPATRRRHRLLKSRPSQLTDLEACYEVRSQSTR
jgi:hypothetical protein